MTLGIDHVLIAVENLERAIEQYHQLGFEAYLGGEHPNHGTHNALVPFSDGFYLELIAIKNPELASQFPHTRRIAGALTRKNRYITYALDTDNISAELDRIRSLNLEIHEPIAGGRKRSDGVEIAWKTAHFDDERLPFIIEDVTARETRIPLPRDGIGRYLNLASVHLSSSDPKELQEICSRIFVGQKTALKAARGTVEIAAGETDAIVKLVFHTNKRDVIRNAWNELKVDCKLEERPDGRSVLIPQSATGAAFQIIST